MCLGLIIVDAMDDSLSQTVTNLISLLERRTENRVWYLFGQKNKTITLFLSTFIKNNFSRALGTLIIVWQAKKKKRRSETNNNKKKQGLIKFYEVL
jgi:hypothetical protein